MNYAWRVLKMLWFESSLEALNQRSKNTLAEHLNICFVEIGSDYLKATMPVDQRTVQPLRILNGGASCALIETAASTAANACIDQTKEYCVGLDINANHLRVATEGSVVSALVTPVHIGRKTQVWSVEISNEKAQKICIGRMTMMVLARDKV